MAISSVTNRVAYQGDGTSAVFAFGYELHSPNDLGVFAFNSSATTPGIIRALVKDAAGEFGFTFTGSVNSAGVYPTGGNVTFNSTPNVQTQIVIFRSSAVTADFLVNKFQPIPGDGVTNAIDRLTMIAQRAQDLNTRSVRLPDGFPGTFDTSLPSNILQSVGKRLIVNSTATGFTFDETLASYIPNTLAYANTNSSITSLGGGTTDLFLKSQGSSAPVWGSIDIGSAAVSAGAITGVLPVSTGGTGQSSFVATALVYAASATQLASIPSALEGSILTAHGSSAPSFDTFSATNINSGLVRVTNGGTGTGTQFPPGQLILAGSAGIYTTGSASLTSHVSGILPVTSGGMGVNSMAPQFGILYASSTTQVAVVPSAALGLVLTANGSSAPSFQAFAQSPLSIASVSANYAASTAEQLILAASSNYTINLYPAVGNSGRQITIRKTSAQVNSSIFISETSILTALHTQNEELVLTSDGAGWLSSRTIPADWVTYVPVGTSFPTITSSDVKSRREGPDLLVKGRITLAAGGTGGEGRFTFGFNGVSGNIVSSSSRVSSLEIAGHGNLDVAAAGQYDPLIEPSKNYFCFGIQSASAGGLSKTVGTNIAGGTISFVLRVAIEGWNG